MSEMAINSSRHFCSTTTSAKFSDSLGSSFCKLHGKSSSISLRSYRFGFSFIKKVKRLSCEGSGSSSRNENWNRNQRQNQFRPSKVVLNRRKEERFSDLEVICGEKSSQSSDVGGGGSTMEKIVEKLKKYGFVDDDQFQDKEVEQEIRIEERAVEDRFYVKEGRGGSSEESPFGVFGGNDEVKFPWEKVSSMEKKELVNGEWTAKKESRYSLAERTLSESELNRLRNVMFRTKSKMRVTGAGVTQAVVDAIQEKWKSSEIVRLKIEGASALNMRRMHEILEVLLLMSPPISVFIYKGLIFGVLK